MKCRLRDADMTANANEPDTSFGDEPPRKALAGAEQLGNLADGQVTLNHSATFRCHHAALPAAGSPDRSSALRLVLAPTRKAGTEQLIEDIQPTIS